MKKVTIITILFLFASLTFLSGQSLNLKLGIFSPTLDSDLWEVNKENLYLSENDMQEIAYSIEFEQFVGRHLSLSIEAGDYSKTLYSQYRDYEYNDGSPIYQNISLSITGVELGIKVYPLGHRKILNPYFGAGVGVYYWEYEQWGDFIDFTTFDVFEGYGYTDAYSAGINLRAGFVFRFKRYLGVSFEAKYQYLRGELSSLFEGFEKLDLSGLTLNVGVNLFFR